VVLLRPSTSGATTSAAATTPTPATSAKAAVAGGSGSRYANSIRLQLPPHRGVAGANGLLWETGCMPPRPVLPPLHPLKQAAEVGVILVHQVGERRQVLRSRVEGQHRSHALRNLLCRLQAAAAQRKG
jgi:hypothetical protein